MKYKKKPVVIEAIKWTGTNIQEIAEFCDNGHGMEEHPNGVDLIIFTKCGRKAPKFIYGDIRPRPLAKIFSCIFETTII